MSLLGSAPFTPLCISHFQLRAHATQLSHQQRPFTQSTRLLSAQGGRLEKLIPSSEALRPALSKFPPPPLRVCAEKSVLAASRLTIKSRNCLVQLSKLEQSLPSTDSGLNQGKLPQLQKFSDHKQLNRQQLLNGLSKITQTLQRSPIHIGFICNDTYFSDEMIFWPQAKYFNRSAWALERNARPSAPLPLENAHTNVLHRPIYGAVNISMLGHTGWGESCFVLKPQFLYQCELRSRDSGNPDGVGYFAKRGTIKQMSMIFEDWARTGQLALLWQAMTTDRRTCFKPSHQLPLETAIYTDEGFISHQDIALIFISTENLSQPQHQQPLIASRCEQLGVPVIFHQEAEGSIPFHDYPEYQRVIMDYEQMAQNQRVDTQAQSFSVV